MAHGGEGKGEGKGSARVGGREVGGVAWGESTRRAREGLTGEICAVVAPLAPTRRRLPLAPANFFEF